MANTAAIEAARARYEHVVRNLGIEVTGRIESGKVSAGERKRSDKMRSACTAWRAYIKAGGSLALYHAASLADHSV